MIDHCEDVSLFAGAVMREGELRSGWDCAGCPAQRNPCASRGTCNWRELTGARLHIAHLSAKASLEQVRAAKSQGLRVTCEVTPHHFTLTDEDVQYDSRFKMNPPLASREDRDALIAGLADGTVDAIATDHAPHEPALKDVEFDRAPFGILGFETAIALALEALVHAAEVSLTRMVEFFTTGPARVLGMERKLAAGQPGDLTIFSTDARMDVPRERIRRANRAILRSTAVNSKARRWPPSLAGRLPTGVRLAPALSSIVQ